MENLEQIIETLKADGYNVEECEIEYREPTADEIDDGADSDDLYTVCTTADGSEHVLGNFLRFGTFWNPSPPPHRYINCQKYEYGHGCYGYLSDDGESFLIITKK